MFFFFSPLNALCESWCRSFFCVLLLVFFFVFTPLTRAVDSEKTKTHRVPDGRAAIEEKDEASSAYAAEFTALKDKRSAAFLSEHNASTCVRCEEAVRETAMEGGLRLSLPRVASRTYHLLKLAGSASPDVSVGYDAYLRTLHSVLGSLFSPPSPPC
jgi:hypothetical protein